LGEIESVTRAKQELQRSFAQRDQIARDLEVWSRQVQNSNGWRALQRYYKLRDRILLKRRWHDL
jgi:hypothetical protein